MKNEKGFSLMYLVITIIVIIIIAAITINSSNRVVDDAIDSKKSAEAAIDDDKIREIISLEIAGTKELIDVDIDYKRIELSGALKVSYKANEYGDGYVLYLSEQDIKKVEERTGKVGLEAYKELTRSYIVDTATGEYIRLEDEWSF